MTFPAPSLSSYVSQQFARLGESGNGARLQLSTSDGRTHHMRISSATLHRIYAVLKEAEIIERLPSPSPPTPHHFPCLPSATGVL